MPLFHVNSNFFFFTSIAETLSRNSSSENSSWFDGSMPLKGRKKSWNYSFFINNTLNCETESLLPPITNSFFYLHFIQRNQLFPRTLSIKLSNSIKQTFYEQMKLFKCTSNKYSGLECKSNRLNMHSIENYSIFHDTIFPVKKKNEFFLSKLMGRVADTTVLIAQYFYTLCVVFFFFFLIVYNCNVPKREHRASSSKMYTSWIFFKSIIYCNINNVRRFEKERFTHICLLLNMNFEHNCAVSNKKDE